jgi:5-hydroxyisourate hydrolase
VGLAGSLTTHVLDTARGCPAADVAIELWRIDSASGERTLVTTARTNSDGRTDAPLLQGAAFTVGIYELIFAIGGYFAKRGIATATPPFLDNVPVRFGVADPATHYHVPLLASPWAYSTYRGS